MSAQTLSWDRLSCAPVTPCDTRKRCAHIPSQDAFAKSPIHAERGIATDALNSSDMMDLCRWNDTSTLLFRQTEAPDELPLREGVEDVEC